MSDVVTVEDLFGVLADREPDMDEVERMLRLLENQHLTEDRLNRIIGSLTYQAGQARRSIDYKRDDGIGKLLREGVSNIEADLTLYRKLLAEKSS